MTAPNDITLHYDMIGLKVCPNCNHDMYSDEYCVECGFIGFAYCTKSWDRMLETYYPGEFKQSKENSS